MVKRKIPPKNYLFLFLIIVLIICACFAAYNLYNIYQDSKISKSPLSNKEVLYDDLKSTTMEIDADTFLVISYVQDEDVHESEKNIKKLLNKKNLLDNVMYLDITEYQNDDEFIDEINKVLKLKGKDKIKKFPALVYYKDGEVTLTVDSKDHLLNEKDFESILEKYELAS